MKKICINYLGGVKNDKRSEELDAAFKQKNQAPILLLLFVDMWITQALTFLVLHTYINDQAS